MRCFGNIAYLIKTHRLNHPKCYSQSELSNLLGYKNGQFISNVERGLCNIPLKMLAKVSHVLHISADDLKNAILRDHEETLDNYFKTQNLGELPKSLSNQTNLPFSDEQNIQSNIESERASSVDFQKTGVEASKLNNDFGPEKSMIHSL